MLAASSGSAARVAHFAGEIAGQTFHHHYHVLYDLRTLLGPSKVDYCEIRSHNGGPLILMIGHDMETSGTSIDPLEVFSTQAEQLAANVARYNTQPKGIPPAARVQHKCGAACVAAR